MVAPERRRVREKEMSDQDRLRATQMRIGRHQRVAALRLARQDANVRCERRWSGGHTALQVKTKIERDLLVARSPCVQSPAGVTNASRPVHARQRSGRLRPAPRAQSGEERRDGPALRRDLLESCPSPERPASRAEHPASSSASAQAQLPVTSSSNSRRSNRMTRRIRTAPHRVRPRNGRTRDAPSSALPTSCATGKADLREAVSMGKPQILMKPSAAL